MFRQLEHEYIFLAVPIQPNRLGYIKTFGPSECTSYEYCSIGHLENIGSLNYAEVIMLSYSTTESYIR